MKLFCVRYKNIYSDFPDGALVLAKDEKHAEVLIHAYDPRLCMTDIELYECSGAIIKPVSCQCFNENYKRI
jgi:hypothetical protein